MNKLLDRISLGLFFVGFLVIANGSARAFAVDAVTTDLDQMKTESAKISTIYGQVAPTAVAALTFGAGAKVLKRVVYS